MNFGPGKWKNKTGGSPVNTRAAATTNQPILLARGVEEDVDFMANVALSGAPEMTHECKQSKNRRIRCSKSPAT